MLAPFENCATECAMATAAAVKDDQPARRFAKDQLKAFVERVERLEEEKKAIADEDRKSTRLNSSHMSISYAVFCMKKTNAELLSSQKATADIVDRATG